MDDVGEGLKDAKEPGSGSPVPTIADDPAEKQPESLPEPPTQTSGRRRSRQEQNQEVGLTQRRKTTQEETETYSDQEYDGKPAPRKQPSKKFKVGRKRAARAKSPDVSAEALFDLTNPRSALAGINLRDLFCSPHAWELLSAEERKRIIAKLPSEGYVDTAEVSASGDDIGPLPNFDRLRNDNNFRNDVACFQQSLASGQYEPARLQQAHDAHEKRMKGFYDSHIISQFEETWGIALPISNDSSQPLSTLSSTPHLGGEESMTIATGASAEKAISVGKMNEVDPMICENEAAPPPVDKESGNMLGGVKEKENQTAVGPKNESELAAADGSRDVTIRKDENNRMVCDNEEDRPVNGDTNGTETKEDQPMAGTPTKDQPPQDPAAGRNNGSSSVISDKEADYRPQMCREQ